MDKQTFLNRYLIDRKNTNCLKWDALDVRFGDPDLTAMWVADMEFKTPECVVEALTERVAHGVYGYAIIPDSYYEAVINWHQKRHKYTLKREWFRHCYGVVPTLYWLVNAFTEVDDSILILTPVYYPFHNAIKDNRRKLVRSELVRSENGEYSMDFADIEKQIIDNKVKMFILCNPHNPAGKVWTEEELAQILSICQKHEVLVIADEIHQDIIPGQKEFIAAARVNDGAFLDNMIIVNAASKTFNLACLLNSNMFIPNAELRAKYDAYAKCVNQIEPNILGLVATEAGYRGGEEWLDNLLDVIRDNYNYFVAELTKHCPEVVISPLEGTYLLWVDLRAYIGSENVKEFMQDKCRVAIDYGEWFSDKCHGFVRFNLATDPQIVKDVVQRLITQLQESKKV